LFSLRKAKAALELQDQRGQEKEQERKDKEQRDQESALAEVRKKQEAQKKRDCRPIAQAARKAVRKQRQFKGKQIEQPEGLKNRPKWSSRLKTRDQ
jgi:hypothetical protein